MGRLVLQQLVHLCNPGLGLTVAGKAVSRSESWGTALLKEWFMFLLYFN